MKLIRTHNSPYGVTGVLLADSGKFLCHTLELPYRSNERDISSIPSASYIAKFHYSDTFQKCVKISDVLDRTGILIHPGNTINDTQGCILVGSGWVDTFTLSESKRAMEDLLKYIEKKYGNEHFFLDVYNARY